jgi:hypothetical protein
MRKHRLSAVVGRRADRAMRRLLQSGLRSRLLLLVVSLCLSHLLAFAETFEVRGTISDPAGRPIQGAGVALVRINGTATAQAVTSAVGRFQLTTESTGDYRVVATAPGFQTVSRLLSISHDNGQYEVDLVLTIGTVELVTVTSNANEIDLFSPDPSEKVFVQQDLIDANPGRPGAPVSIPGFPIETASGGIKAPQYFAPGVAADHGEPVAQYISVGGYLLPNNLSANAHGNGYADPNILIPQILADVQVDGGSFNVLEGNHSLNLAAIYGLRSQVAPFLTASGDYRDIDLVEAFSRGSNAWIAVEGSYGNGFLKRLEHRQQYKVNGQRIFDAGQHRLTLLGIAYYGFSYVPGLVPIGEAPADYPNVGDTVDPRQKDQTHTALLALNDDWTLNDRQHLEFAGFFRTYNLSLYSDFGEGLIRQSEFRTAAGVSANYANEFTKSLGLLAGLDVEREAPRRDDLDHFNFYTPGDMNYGSFTKVDGSDITITPIAPYAALKGEFGSHLRYYLGWRRDQIAIDNQDLVLPQNSFDQWVGVNSPKATVSVIPGAAKWAPLVSASAGESFFTEDPRIGTGTGPGSLVSRAHDYQLVASKLIAHTDLKLTLGHVTTAEQLAKINPDTGLQEDQGPGRLRFLTAAVRQNFNAGSVLFTFSKADARDIQSGQPTAEAPRTIFDVLGVTQALPMRLQAKGEFEYVGAKPLGTGCVPDPTAQCVGVAVKEFRGAMARAFEGGRFNVGVNLLLAKGYTGQTLETFYPSANATVTGVRIPSYASVSFTYRFGEHPAP